VSIVVVYFSEAGTTHQVAEAIRVGAVSDSTAAGSNDCQLLRVTDDNTVDGRFNEESYLSAIDSATAVIFGSPTYMGGPAAQFKAFADATSDRWDTQAWNGKLAAGFTVGSNPGGDQLSTLQYFTILAAQHGMLWVNLNMPADHEINTENKPGAQLGFAGTVPGDNISEADTALAQLLGARVASYCRKFAPQS